VLWRAVFYLPRRLDGSGIELRELPGAFAAPQSALLHREMQHCLSGVFASCDDSHVKLIRR
jgi:hypothetical protein